MRKFEKIFVGHGANAEESIFSDYMKTTNALVLRINVITLENMEKFCVPSLLLLIHLLVKHAFGVSTKIKKISNIPAVNLLDFMTIAALNVGEYVFFRVFFQMARMKGANETIFLALHIAAHSCKHEELNTFYWSHGLIRLSIPMIQPDRAIVLTSEEQKYLSFSFNGKVDCTLIKNYTQIDTTLKNIVLVISPETFFLYPDNTQKHFFSFFLWAKSVGLAIVLRPTQKTSKAALFDLKKQLPCVFELDDISRNLEISLKTLTPKFVMGFSTTGFFTALSFGIIPISVCDPGNDSRIYDTIYPLKKRVLFWPSDLQVTEELMFGDDMLYKKQVVLLKEAIDGELY